MRPWMPDGTPPLAGLRVLEAARVLAGPYCGQVLADLGADVVKVERPDTGDDTRAWGPPFHGSFSAYFLSCNRSKRSVALDLQDAADAERFQGLLARADVLIENFRHDSLARLGLEPAALLARYPQLIICSISGYGRTGPRKDDPGYDFAIQALSGLMAITGPEDGEPSKVGVALADVLTGLYASTAILAACRAREQSGHGYHIDLALLDCAVASQVNVAQAYLCSGQVVPRQGNAHAQIVPYRQYRTADGWLVITVGNDRQWRAFCDVLDQPRLADDRRFRSNADRVEHREELEPILEDILIRRATETWERRLTRAGVPCAEVRNHADVFHDPQLLSRGMRVTVTDPSGQPIDLVGSPFHWNGARPTPPRFPPGLGEHTAEVLRDWNVTS